MPPITPTLNSVPKGGEGKNNERQVAAGEGSTESSCLPVGSREVAEAGSEEERKDHMRRFRLSRGLPTLKFQSAVATRPMTPLRSPLTVGM